MIIAFAGQISSGKSTLARALSEDSGWDRFSFGEYVGSCAELVGLDPKDRETLQDLGEFLSKRPDRFARGFLAWTGRPENMIIDGIRHVSILQAIRAQSGQQAVKLVFVDTPLNIVKQRFVGNLSKARSHAVESDIENLKARSDIVLPGSSAEDLKRVLDELLH
jgi:dephospho-CoA kinase